MNRLRRLCSLVFLSVALVWLASGSPSRAGLADALKKKITDKATKKAEDTVDKAADKKPATPATSGEKDEGETAEGDKAGKSEGDAAGGDGKVSSVSTKFDFVPGDKVMFIDDFKQDDLGEFPAHWTLSIGTFEVAEMKGERWLRCVSADGTIGLKMPAAALPEFWTLELDFYGTEPMGSALTVRAVGEGGRTCWEATYPHDLNMAFRSGEVFSTTPLEGITQPAGRHHVMFMARGTALKGYMDRQRLVNVPDISAYAGMPTKLEIRLWASTQPMITNLRLAEGCKPAKDMLAQGKLVTYGIHFATGSDVVLPESAPILRQISSYMEANPEVKLRITGHTDNVGASAANLDLSKRRAASVAKVLSEQFAVAADRFATDGKGDTQSVSSNAKPEGRAMNRRVEFAKLQ